ncbi:MAG: response regulator transcription factor [Opitutales bacterium]|nr:response regulator transcription factor [Opitutales bacterium]
MHLKLLYIEDNVIIRERLSETLRENGFSVKEIPTAAEARIAFEQEDFDLVLLDVLLPDGNGLDLLRELRFRRKNNAPVIILSALGEIVDERISGLESGANDYLSKPFSARELIARIHAVIRNARPNTPSSEATFFPLNGGKLDLVHPCIHKDDGTKIPLSIKEFRLLIHFSKNIGKTVSIEEILSDVWDIDPEKISTTSPAVLISRLRRKVENLCKIESCRNSGYRFHL